MIGSLTPNPEFDRMFLESMAPLANDEIDRHQAQRKDWNFHEILTRNAISRLSIGEVLEVDDSVRSIFLGNLAVEKGHAEYDRITAERFEENPSFRRWKNIWISEEEPHGAAMLEWAKVTGLFAREKQSPGQIDTDDVHRAVQGFLQNGLSLRFDDAAFALAYPALQEPATKITHKEVKIRLPDEAKEGRILMSKIIADEERHERFYVNMVKGALQSGEVDIASHQMKAIARAIIGFSMPGIETDIPGGQEITKNYQKTGAFTVGKVAREVLLPAMAEGSDSGWGIAAVSQLDDGGKYAQESLVSYASKLEEVADNDRRLLIVMGKAKKALLSQLEEQRCL